jgi:hypothetical protein
MSSSSSHASPYPVPPGNFPHDAWPHTPEIPLRSDGNPPPLSWVGYRRRVPMTTRRRCAPVTTHGRAPWPRCCTPKRKLEQEDDGYAWGNQPKLELEREPATSSSSTVGGHRTRRRGRMTTTTTMSPALVPTGGGAATTGRRRCYHQPPTLLPPTMLPPTRQRCYQGRRTTGRQRCANRPPVLLPSGGDIAPIGRRRCSQRAATCCYHGSSVVLPWRTRMLP